MAVDERKNKRIAAASTIGMHALLLVFFFFAVGWRAPNPPYPDYGIELNFGLDDQGSGEIQPTTPVGTQPEEVKKEETQPNQTPEEKPAEADPKTTEQLTSKDETAVAIKDVKKEEVPTKAVEKPTEKKEEKTPPKEDPKPIAVYNPNKDKSDGKAGQPGNQGDDVNKTGDKGKKEGQLGPGAYTGKPGGGGGGIGLNMDGWLWDEKPKVTPPEDESPGRLVFQIKVNAEGEIIDIKKLDGALSIEMENRCRREIEKLTFSPTGNNMPAVSIGKITFTVLSR